MSSDSQHSQLRYREIFWFWLPLASTWVLMAMEGPFLAAMIARMGEPKLNLAAYGIAFSFGLLAEAPIIMLLSAATALVTDLPAYRTFRTFSFGLCVLITIGSLIGVLPGVFFGVIQPLLGIDDTLAGSVHLALLWLLPWPAAIGVRRMYQGLLIRTGKTRSVAFGTFVRLTTVVGTAFVLQTWSSVPGVVLGTASLSAGVVAEALIAMWMARAALEQLQDLPEDLANTTVRKYRSILYFYYPLALTAMIGLVGQPLVTFFVTRAVDPLESLAVIPVVNSFVFLFRAVGLSYQEVGIAMMGRGPENRKVVQQFASILAIVSFSLYLLVAFTPLADLWLERVAGLSLTLAAFALVPLQIQCLMPLFVVGLNFLRSMLVFRKRTFPVSIASTMELLSIGILMMILIEFTQFNGAIAASIAIVLGRGMALLYIAAVYRREFRGM